MFNIIELARATHQKHYKPFKIYILGIIMDNPGIRTLTTFLERVKKHQPANFSTLSTTKKGKLFGMTSKYLPFCLKHNLITIIETKTGGRGRPSKTYALTKNGEKLTQIFTHILGEG